MVLKASVFLMWVLVVGFACQEPTSAEARPVPFLAQQRYSKIFSTLGVVCKCCDGAAAVAGGGNQCSITWDGTCSDLRCLPWKFRS